MRRNAAVFIPVSIVLVMLTWGCARDTSVTTATGGKTRTVQKQSASIYTGKIVGRSNKAGTISIVVGKGDRARTMMVRFDDRTRGLEHAVKGRAAIITWELRGSEKVATVIKPKLAKLPPGVTEIKPAEVRKLIESGADHVLIDSRPGNRYDQAHLPGAVSIPVDRMKTALKTLPPRKDILLVFYCGGYT